MKAFSSCSKRLQSPGDPYYAWIPSVSNKRVFCMLRMFQFFATNFGICLSASSLLIAVDTGILLLLAFHAFNYAVLCAHMAQKGELFSFSVVAHPSTFNSYIGPFIIWSIHYLPTCAAPLLIAAAPVELGAGTFSSLVVWSSIATGVMLFIGLGVLENHPYLNMTNSMVSYGGTMLLHGRRTLPSSSRTWKRA